MDNDHVVCQNIWGRSKCCNKRTFRETTNKKKTKCFKKDDKLQKDFLQDLGLLIVKNQLPFVVCGKCLL